MLFEIFEYILENKIVSLKSISNTFNLHVSAVEPMLALLIRKGRIKRHLEQQECHRGCCQSNSSRELFCVVS